MKEPKKNHSLYLTTELSERIKIQAEKEHRKFNATITIAIEKYLKEIEEND